VTKILFKNIQPLLIVLLGLGLVGSLFSSELKSAVIGEKLTRQDMILEMFSKSGQTIRLVDIGKLATGDWRLFCILGPGVNPARILPREAGISNAGLKINILDRVTRNGEMTFAQITPQGVPSLHVRPHDIDIVMPERHICVRHDRPTAFLPVGAKDYAFYR